MAMNILEGLGSYHRGWMQEMWREIHCSWDQPLHLAPWQGNFHIWIKPWRLLMLQPACHVIRPYPSSVRLSVQLSQLHSVDSRFVRVEVRAETSGNYAGTRGIEAAAMTWHAWHEGRGTIAHTKVRTEQAQHSHPVSISSQVLIHVRVEEQVVKLWRCWWWANHRGWGHPRDQSIHDHSS